MAEMIDRARLDTIHSGHSSSGYCLLSGMTAC
jgi:hypothetical protein